MKVDASQSYSLPVLDILEGNLEATINKVRSEKDRKIAGEINYLENLVRYLNDNKEKFSSFI